MTPLPATPRVRSLVEHHTRHVGAALAAYAILVIAVAKLSVFGHAAVSHWNSTGRPDIEGYPSRAWPIWPAALPVAWFIYCWLMRKIIGFKDDPNAPAQMAVSKDVTISGDLPTFVEAFRNSCYSGYSFWMPVIITAILSLVDLWPVIAVYAEGHAVKPRTWAMDWSIMAVATSGKPPSIGANWMFNTMVYLQQWIATALAVQLTWVVVKHSLAFLMSIHCGPKPPTRFAIRVNVADSDHFFGLGGARSIFNYQMGVAIASGLVALSSRVGNTKVAVDAALNALKNDDKLSSWLVEQLTEHTRELFPSIGQVMLTLAWAGIVISACVPALIKFLPILRGVRTGSGCNYVQAFLPSEDGRDCDEVIKGFRKQSFWPAGDAWALLLIFANSMLGLNMLVPAFELSALPASLHAQVLYVALSATATVVFWAVFRFGLALKYPILVPYLLKIGGEDSEE